MGFIPGRHIRKSSLINRLIISVDQEWKTTHLIDSEMALYYSTVLIITLIKKEQKPKQIPEGSKIETSKENYKILEENTGEGGMPLSMTQN